jgi:hypothetical protein
MSSTPSYFSRTMAAGARADVHGSARYLTIYSLTPGSTIDFGFGDDSPIRLAGPLTIDFGALQGNARFTRVVFRNAGGAAATLEGYFSNVRISGTFSELSVLVNIQTLLTTLNAQIIGGAGTLLADTVCAVTGGAGTQLFAANAGRKLVELQADPVNGAELIYLGYDNTVSDVNKFYTLAAGDPWWCDREKGPIFAVSSLGTGVVYGREV